MGHYLNAKCELRDRNGEPIVEPVPGTTDDKRTMLAGRIILMALDASLPSDAAQYEQDKGKWVAAVVDREELAAKLQEALADDSDGLVELDKDERQMILTRLAECVVPRKLPTGQTIDGMSNAVIGPVLRAVEKAPKEHPRAAKGNGKDAEATLQ